MNPAGCATASGPPSYTAGEAGGIIGGRLVWGSPEATFAGVAYDSRRVGAGELFYATPGDRTDGHLYLGDAVAAGATCLVVSRWSEAELAGVLSGLARREGPPAGPGGAPAGPAGSGPAVIQVDDTVLALGRLAQHHRSRYRLPVTAITGSVGKTTTKDMTGHIVSRHLRALVTGGNLNSDVSLPVVLMGLSCIHQAAVLELAMRGFGQIAYLAGLCRPSSGVITAVAAVHVDSVGSVAGVAMAKAELLRALPAGGVAIYPASSPELAAELASRPLGGGAVAVTFGDARSGADVCFGEVGHAIERTGQQVAASLSFSVRCRPGPAAERLSLPAGPTLRARLSYPGRHNVSNAVSAALAATTLGLPLEAALEELATFAPPSAMRLDLRVLGGLLLIDDAYNANLLSMTSALEVLVTAAGRGRKAAILGDMRELGPLEAETHRELGSRVASAGVDLLIVFGRAILETAAAAVASGLPPDRILVATTHDQAAEMVLDWLRPGDSLLVKGSRGLAMEQIVDRIRSRWAG